MLGIIVSIVWILLFLMLCVFCWIMKFFILVFVLVCSYFRLILVCWDYFIVFNIGVYNYCKVLFISYFKRELIKSKDMCYINEYI